MNGLKGRGLDHIDTDKMRGALKNVSTDEVKTFKNLIDCFEELQWWVINSVKGFGQKGESLSEDNYRKLMSIGLSNGKIAFPKIEQDASLKAAVESQLKLAINGLLADTPEKKADALDAVRTVITIEDDKLDALSKAISEIVDSKVGYFCKNPQCCSGSYTKRRKNET